MQTADRTLPSFITTVNLSLFLLIGISDLTQCFLLLELEELTKLMGFFAVNHVLRKANESRHSLVMTLVYV